MTDFDDIFRPGIMTGAPRLTPTRVAQTVDAFCAWHPELGLDPSKASEFEEDVLWKLGSKMRDEGWRAVRVEITATVEG